MISVGTLEQVGQSGKFIKWNLYSNAAFKTRKTLIPPYNYIQNLRLYTVTYHDGTKKYQHVAQDLFEDISLQSLSFIERKKPQRNGR